MCVCVCVCVCVGVGVTLSNLHDVGMTALTCSMDGSATITTGMCQITLPLLIEILDCWKSTFLRRKVEWSSPYRNKVFLNILHINLYSTIKFVSN